MKKFLLFAAACVALVACNNNDNALCNAPEATLFAKGQKVTLTVNSGSQDNQAPARKISGTDNGSTIDFKWETGDKILVKVGEATAEFTLKSGAGTAEAVFEGTMPAEGSSFDIQYPIEAPVLTQQFYSATKAIPSGMMLFKAENCTLEEDGSISNVTLEVQNAILQLNLYTSVYVANKISPVTYIKLYVDGTPQYTLTMDPGVELGTTEADSKPFYFVLPVGINITGLYVGDANNSTYINFPQSIEFKAGECINMAACKAMYCFAAGTRITMADGSTKAIENIQKGDRVRTFDHEAGQLSEEAVCYVFDNGSKSLSFTLHFASGNTVSIVDKHDLLVESSRKYVVVSEANATSFVGQRFYNADKAQWDELTEVTFGTTPTKFYTIYSANHINTIANGLLTCPDDIDFNLNIYEMDASLKADPVQLAADRAQYGSYTHADFPELTKDLDAFDALNRNTKIALGKGLVTWERLMQIYEDYK